MHVFLKLTRQLTLTLMLLCSAVRVRVPEYPPLGRPSIESILVKKYS